MRRFRVVSQWVFGSLFVFLFLNTRYLGEDILQFPVNVFFRLDPLAGFTSMLAARQVLSFFWPLLLLLPATFLFGRFFCGWICPMGGLLDLFGARSRMKSPAPGGSLIGIKEFTLVLLLSASMISLNLSGLLDPISFLIRSLAIGVVPPLERAVHGVFDAGYRIGEPVSSLSEPVYQWLQSNLLSFRPPAFRYVAFFLLLILTVLYLEIRERRFWCRNLCPLGCLLGWFAAKAPLGLRIGETGCESCGECRSVCRMGAIGDGPDREIRRKDCILCYDCLEACRESVIGHSFVVDVPEDGSQPTFDISRRLFLSSAGLGLTAPLSLGTLASVDTLPAGLIRPPGSRPEEEFLDRCVRCGECMRVCLTGGLQPTLFESGLQGLWTPRLISRIGYCEYSCTLCGQVCPTGAIEDLHPFEKRKVRIGTAVIDRNLCIPFLRPEECMVCEEHCPTPQKAIVFDHVVREGDRGPVTVKQPRVIDDLCIGCGICENKCPVEGRSAIPVIRSKEDRSMGRSV